MKIIKFELEGKKVTLKEKEDAFATNILLGLGAKASQIAQGKDDSAYFSKEMNDLHQAFFTELEGSIEVEGEDFDMRKSFRNPASLLVFWQKYFDEIVALGDKKKASVARKEKQKKS